MSAWEVRTALGGLGVPAQLSTNDELIAILKGLKEEIRRERLDNVGPCLPIRTENRKHSGSTCQPVYPPYAGKELINTLIVAKEWVSTVDGLLSVGQGPFPPANDVIAALSAISDA
jgi:hypothetical protein